MNDPVNRIQDNGHESHDLVPHRGSEVWHILVVGLSFQKREPQRKDPKG